MRKYLIIILVFIFSGLVFCGKTDTLSSSKKVVKKALVKKTVNKSSAASQHSCEKNCSSSCMEKCRNSTDYFIDKDNDGICDNRAKGMGFNSKNRCSENGCKGQTKAKAK